MRDGDGDGDGGSGSGVDEEDARWMRRALRMVSLSLGATWPNPGVGCVLVKNGVLIGAGRHEVCGREHAEVNALTDCRRRGHDPAGAVAYVTLAPCTHHGRQPPCVDALIAAKLARVVAAIADPMQDDAGALLRQHGIAYAVGVEAALATHLHGGFLSRLMLKRPRFTGKWAMTLDGCIAAHTGDSRWISSAEALTLSRRRRRAFDAIMVGTGTALRDDPTLLATRVRRVDGQSPVRVVVGRNALNPSARLLTTGAQAPLLTIAEHDPLPVARQLGALGFNEVLVEGGAQLHGAWLRAGLYDRLEIYLGLRTLGGGLAVTAGAGAPRIDLGAAYALEQPPMVLGDTVCLRLTRKSETPGA